ncbi:flagellar motor protein MotB [Nisaea sp.]|uniref:OmpA/MotB family protein n=1 Tax=Nisaea sp. TaxID=2024842 RepID=UPI003263A37C
MKYRTSRRGGSETRQGGTWMVTFVDLVSLLLAFFVLLFSMTSPDAPQWEAFTASLRSTFSADSEKRSREALMPESVETEDPGTGVNLGYLRRLLEVAMSRDAVLQNATIIEKNGRLILSMASDVFFQPGAAAMQPSGEEALFDLAVALSRIDNRIDIVGHTDPRPFTSPSGSFRSNWDLSLARALSVADTLQRFGYRKPIEVRGAADGKFGEIDSSLPLEDRYRRARRVDLVIYHERDRR